MTKQLIYITLAVILLAACKSKPEAVIEDDNIVVKGWKLRGLTSDDYNCLVDLLAARAGDKAKEAGEIRRGCLWAFLYRDTSFT